MATVAVAGCGDTEAFSPTREGPGVSWTAQQRGSPRQYQGAEFSPLATTEARTRRRTRTPTMDSALSVSGGADEAGSGGKRDSVAEVHAMVDQNGIVSTA